MNQFCDCDSEGWCQRYQREMGKRCWEICSGINVDLGTAAAFRDEWRHEMDIKQTESIAKTKCHCWGVNTEGRYIPAFACPECKGTGFKPLTIKVDTSPIPLLLQTDQAPGDAVVMTVAIYSLHKAHPGKYLTAVESPYPEIFQYNHDICLNVMPHQITPGERDHYLPVRMHYPAIHQSNERGIHFMQGYCEHLGHALGINVPLLTNKPHLYFDYWAEPDVGGYWLACSGGKNDFTNKLWGHHRYQEVINRLYKGPNKVHFIQVGDKLKDHDPLVNTVWQVGQTNLRQLFEQVRRARGVLCGVSLLMHVAAALDKPCVVIAGGREPVQWNCYPKQHYLHTIGQLPCSDSTGRIGNACWRSRVLPQGDNRVLDKDPCLYPVMEVGKFSLLARTVTPKCMTLIEPKTVAELILNIDRSL